VLIIYAPKRTRIKDKSYMTTKQQSGFGVIPIIVIVAIVVVLGLVDYQIYTAQMNKPAANSSTTNNQTSPASSQPSNTTPNPAQQADPNAGYVVIKEWNVRFKPVSGLTGVEYTKANSNTHDEINF